MALILAIEPEREQAALLSTLIRCRLSAELVLADTTAQALVAIGDRVPDLVLIPTLLSPQEDAALAGALRMIAAAAQVQMLTIPFLAAPSAVPERRGVLAKWRRGRKAAPSPSGCDPAVFADQIAAYLAETDGAGAVDTVPEAIAETPVETIAVAQPAVRDVPFVEVEASAPSVSAPIASIAVDEPMAPVTCAPLSFALIDWQHALADTAASRDSAPPLSEAPISVVEEVVAAEGPALSQALFIEVQQLAVEGGGLNDAAISGVEEIVAAEGPALSQALFIEVQELAVEGLGLDDAAVNGVEEIVAAEGPALRDVPFIGVEELAVEGVASTEELSDDPMVRAIQQFVAAPIAADPVIVEDSIVQPIDEMATAPALSEALSAGVVGPALDDAPSIGLEGHVLSEAPSMAVEAVSSETMATTVEGPMAAITTVEAAPVEQPIVDESTARWVEEATVAATGEDIAVADEPSDKLWIHEPSTGPLTLAAVAEVARVDEAALQTGNDVVARPIVESEVVVDFDETPVYELSLDELASDAALMASIDAMMASRVRPQASGVRDQAPGPRSPAPEKSVREHQASDAARQASEETMLVSQPAVDMPAVEDPARVDWIPQLQTEPDPLFFCDAEPAPSPIEGRVPREPAAPLAAAAGPGPAKPERPEWVELIESLRKDIERLKAERAEPAAHAPIATASSRAPVASAARKAKRSKPAATKTPRPAQDEWGLFDPEQCGFASLLAKLSEITDVNDSGSSSRELHH